LFLHSKAGPNAGPLIEKNNVLKIKASDLQVLLELLVGRPGEKLFFLEVKIEFLTERLKPFDRFSGSDSTGKCQF
jgi:hypothetical protein